MDNKEIYTTPQVAKILEMPMRKILSYIERGYVTPSLRDASGHGSSRQWAVWDLDKICLVRKCENLGVSVSGLRTLGRTLVPPFWPGVLLQQKHPWLVMNEHGDMAPIQLSLSDQVRTVGTPCLVLNWKDIKAEVQEMIEKTVL